MHRLQEMLAVAARRAVADEDIRREPRIALQAAEQFEFFRPELAQRIGVRRVTALALEIEHLSLMIARQYEPTRCHEIARRLTRHQRPGQVVAQADDAVDLAARDVRNHGLQRWQVAMNVGDKCDAFSSHDARYSYTIAAAPCSACAIQLASAASLGKNFESSPNCSSAVAPWRCTCRRTARPRTSSP